MMRPQPPPAAGNNNNNNNQPLPLVLPMSLPASAAEQPRLVYGRPDNPTYVQVESVLAAMDGGVGAALFASGMAATAGMAQALLRVGDRMVCPSYSYYATRSFPSTANAVGSSLCCSTHRGGSLEAAIGNDGKTKLVWVETPANPSWTVTDIARAAAATHACANATLVVGATVLTPLICRPIDFGADFVCTARRNISADTRT